MSFEVGQPCTPYTTFVDISGVAQDPYSVAITITPPTGSGISPYTLTYGTDPALIRDATTKEYSCTVANTAAGQWTAHWVSHGPPASPLDGATSSTIHWLVITP